tara:strand:+ start:3402 stop:4637 length:1236 start_codon:yes stop_codon:yes gene_type:complete
MNNPRKNKLALQGGSPIIDKKLIPQWPKYNLNNTIFSIDAVLKTGIWGIGSNHIREFEHKFAKFQDAKHGVAVANGSIALYVALKACEINLGDEVIIPSYTFQATAISVLLANAIPVFSDIDPDTYNIDPDSVISLISKKTKAVIAVHIGGQPANMGKLKEICKKYNILLIEDAAQAHGAKWMDQKVGAIGDVGIFSFQSSKNMTAGEGGIVVTNSNSIYEKAVTIHDCGRNPNSKKYEPEISSLNFRMSAISASILLPQFDTIENDISLRSKNAEILDNSLKEIDGIEPLEVNKGVTIHSRHLYILRYKKNEFFNLSRKILISALVKEGLPIFSGYLPLHHQLNKTIQFENYPWIDRKKYFNITLQNSEKAAYEEALWLPQNLLLGSEEFLESIVKAFQKVKENGLCLKN